jgi:DNA-binding NarL/FixJ family response regulator
VTRVLLVDNHPIVLHGCKELLAGAGANEVDQAQSASEGFRIYRERKPDVIIVDLAMQAGALNGLSFVRRLRRIDSETPILVLTLHRDPMIVNSAFELGANGYIFKDAPAEELVKAFKKACEGGSNLSRELSADLEFVRMVAESTKFDDLTSREAQILMLLVGGKSQRKIAKMLDVSCSTVARTCTQLKVKLGVRTRQNLIRIALEHVPAARRKAATGIRRRRSNRVQGSGNLGAFRLSKPEILP